MGLACAGAGAIGCAAKEETTPLGYVVAPSVASDAASTAAVTDAGSYSTTTAASDARR
jgi:hypothetical protein